MATLSETLDGWIPLPSSLGVSLGDFGLPLLDEWEWEWEWSPDPDDYDVDDTL